MVVDAGAVAAVDGMGVVADAAVVTGMVGLLVLWLGWRLKLAERVVTTAHGENGLARATSGDAQESSALIATTSGSRGGGAQNMRNSGGGRRRQQHPFCHYHNTSQHDDSNCPARRGLQSQVRHGGKGGGIPRHSRTLEDVQQ